MERYRRDEKPSAALAAAVGLCLIILWQGIGMAMAKPYILPTPIQVLVRMWELRGPLLTVHLPATMGVTALGLIISIVLGLGLAIMMAEFPAWESALYPVVVSSQTIPTTAIAPLFVLWFGYSVWSKVLVTILMTFFPIVINVHNGLKSAKRDQIELLLTYGATRRQIFWKLKVWTALPHFVASIKMAVPLSLIGAAIAEWLGGQAGLGYFSKRMITQLDGAAVFAPIVLLSVVAIILVFFIGRLERRLITWTQES
ncbi:MAG TPA: ABC transporter permease [Clostridiaceae bacterium]|nr:ABC transporter permease [Clostridiaceae bacterium]